MRTYIYLFLFALMSTNALALILTNEDRNEGITFVVIMKGRKYSDRQEIPVPPRTSVQEFFKRWQRRNDGFLFQINVKDGRRQRNCAVQKGSLDRYEVIYAQGRCMLRRR